MINSVDHIYKNRIKILHYYANPGFLFLRRGYFFIEMKRFAFILHGHINHIYMIRHSVIFKLKYSKGSAEESAFLQATEKLANIPGVKTFEQLQQVSKKNKFDYGLSMEFDNQDEYDVYNNHPAHTAFIQQFWIPGVEDFLEIDYILRNK